MKRGAITRKNIIMLVILGLSLLLGTGLAAGAQFYLRMMEVYRNMAYSYLDLAVLNIDGSLVRDIMAREEDLRALSRKINEIDVRGMDVDEYDRIRQQLMSQDPELEELYTRWEKVDGLIFTSVITSDLRYLYIVIPTEDELIYLWDSDFEQERLTDIAEHSEYPAGDKEFLLRAFQGDWDRSAMVINRYEGEILGTAVEPIYDMDNQIVAVAALDVSVSSIQKSFLWVLLNLAFVITLILILTGTVYFIAVRKNVIKPLLTLEQAALQLVDNLEKGEEGYFTVNVHTGDEIEVLARSFEEMERKLRAYIRENAAITAERERIEMELSLAARIQTNILPEICPPVSLRKEFEIAARMVPAKEIGGDFYDFFLIDNDHLGLVMADVSGKGIPAALFMMMSKIMLQIYAQTSSGPKEVLETVNNMICQNNKTEMFVTVWIGILDIRTGTIRASNAGHEYPILKQPGGPFTVIKDRHGFVLGGMEEMVYREYELKLEPGAVLLLYTDGLPEAANGQEQLFGMDRIVEAINRKETDSPEEVLNELDEAVSGFAGNAPQFDDLTILCLKYNGSGLPVLPAGTRRENAETYFVPER